MKLSPERWARVEPHFDAAWELPESERAAYVAGLEAEDAELAADLRDLLATETTSDPWQPLEESAPELLSAIARERDAGGEPALEDRQLGPYRIVETLGRGGMSVVYLAERTDGKFEQRVAVKVLHWTAGRTALLRFRQEQQMLARLMHPSITRIFDSGTTDDQLPYFVMEWVDGIPFTRYCREHRLPVRDRVKLFLSVCDAVHNAHQALVVHRDLKPANVLVTREGHVKVLDFGIAKWMAPDAGANAPLVTRQDEGLLTPQYAAPEQFLGHTITTAADVYSLGLLLYEILAGSPPYELSGKPITEQQRLVCESIPPPASTVAAEGAERQSLRGDLETICAKALQKEPDRRYASAAALADDLRRYLSGLPVLAAPDSVAYRVSKLVRRHRGGVALAGAALLALVAGGAGMAWQARLAESERDRARLEAALAQQVVEFLVGTLEEANPYSASGGNVTVRELLERSVARVDSELGGQPGLQSRLFTTLAQVLGHSGEPARALGYADRGVHMADSLYGVGSLESTSARYQKARLLAHTDSPQTEAFLLECEEVLREIPGRDGRLLLASVLEDRAILLERRGLGDSSVAMLRKCLAVREELHGDEPHSDLARSHHHLASALSAFGNPEAVPHFGRAADLWRQTLGKEHPNYASTLNNWALWYQRSGQPDSAEILYRRALEVDRKALGPRSAPLASRLINLSSLALNQGRFATAREWLMESVSILDALEERHFELGAAHTNLGHAAFFEGDWPTAEREYLEGRRRFVRVYGPDHPFPAVVDGYLGRLHAAESRREEARAELRRANEILGAQLPSLASRYVLVRAWQGRFLLAEDPASGLEQLRDAAALAREHLPDASPERAEVEAALGLALIQCGQAGEGVPILRAGADALALHFGERHPFRIEVETGLRQADPNARS